MISQRAGFGASTCQGSGFMFLLSHTKMGAPSHPCRDAIARPHDLDHGDTPPVNGLRDGLQLQPDELWRDRP